MVPISAHIQFKTLVLILKSKPDVAPTYLMDGIRSPLSAASHWPLRSLDRHVHTFIPDISIALLQVHYYSEALPTTALWYCVGDNMLKRYRQLWVKDLPKVPAWRLERDSNLGPSRRKAPNLTLSHHVPLSLCSLCVLSVPRFRTTMAQTISFATIGPYIWTVADQGFWIRGV